MRILMVSRALPFHSLGGMEAVAWDYARSFRDIGHDVTILTSAGDHFALEGWAEGIRIETIHARYRRYSGVWWRRSADFFDSEGQSFDVVLSIGRGARTMVLRRRQRHPVFVLQAHGTSWGELISKWRQRRVSAALKSAINLLGLWEDRLFSGVDAVIAVGPPVYSDLKRLPTRWTIGSVPTHLIENGIPEDRFAFDNVARQACRDQLQLPPHSRVVLCASRLHPQKGVWEAIEGFLLAAPSQPELHLIIAGAGPDEARLKARSVNSEAADRIHFLGIIPRDRLSDWLSAADVFLFSTKRAEGLPLNVLEALAAGLPIVASIHVSDPRFGAIAVNPIDPASIAKGITSAIELISEDRATRLPGEFTLKHSAARYVELFSQLMDAEEFADKNRSDCAMRSK